MQRATQHRYSGKDPMRATAFVALCLFCFQVVRFYVVIPLDAYTCGSLDYTYGDARSTHHHDFETNQPDHDHDQALPQDDDDRQYFQHCKDTLNGLALSPVQPFGLPVLVTQQGPQCSWANLATNPHKAIENYLPPPFQPPRQLGQLSVSMHSHA